MWTALSAAAIWRSLSGSTVQSLCTCGSVNALDPPPGCQTCECFHFEEADEESGRWIQWIQLRSFQPSDRTRTDVLTPANKFRLQNLLNAKENKNSPGSITDLMCSLMGLDTKLTGNCHSCGASSHHQQMPNTWGGQSEAGVKVSSLSFKCCRWNCKVQRFSWEGNQLEI